VKGQPTLEVVVLNGWSRSMRLVRIETAHQLGEICQAISQASTFDDDTSIFGRGCRPESFLKGQGRSVDRRTYPPV